MHLYAIAIGVVEQIHPFTYHTQCIGGGKGTSPLASWAYPMTAAICLAEPAVDVG